MEGKESQKDILRLRHLESAKHENGSASTESERMDTNTTPSSTSTNSMSLNSSNEQNPFVAGGPSVFEIPTQTLIENNVNN